MEDAKNINFDAIVTHLQTTGYIYQGSQIYGGLANTWDYGPLGSQLKKNLKDTWRKEFVENSEYNVGLDTAILMNPRVWEATGHVQTFNDPQIECKSCHSRFRADTLISNQFPDVNVEKMTFSEMDNFIKENNIKCESCGKSNFTDIKKFNLMFKTHIGVTEDTQDEVYLRPETAQGVFVNFKNVQRTSRKKLPFGIANTGKAFRNEITPGNFIFRTREFEQMELEFFCYPGTDLEWFEYWKTFCQNFLINKIGINEKDIRLREHAKEELAFYSKATVDIEYNFPFGWGEVRGIADRTDYDLKRHIDYSKESLEYFDPETNNKIIPYVIEPSLGLDRLFLMTICNAYDEEVLDDGSIRKVMKIKPSIAPIKVSVLPLSKQLNELSLTIFHELRNYFNTSYDVTGSIGKRYRRNDEIGTPFCVTIDFDSLNDQMVTVRERDSMKQKRILIKELKDYLLESIR